MAFSFAGEVFKGASSVAGGALGLAGGATAFVLTGGDEKVAKSVNNTCKYAGGWVGNKMVHNPVSDGMMYFGDAITGTQGMRQEHRPGDLMIFIGKFHYYAVLEQSNGQYYKYDFTAIGIEKHLPVRTFGEAQADPCAQGGWSFTSASVSGKVPSRSPNAYRSDWVSGLYGKNLTKRQVDATVDWLKQHGFGDGDYKATGNNCKDFSDALVRCLSRQ